MPSGSRAIPGAKEGEYLKDLQKPWWRVRKATGLDDVRIHDLRYTCATWIDRIAGKIALVHCNTKINQNFKKAAWNLFSETVFI